MNTHLIAAEHLTIKRIGEIIRGGIKLELSDDARQRASAVAVSTLWSTVKGLSVLRATLSPWPISACRLLVLGRWNTR